MDLSPESHRVSREEGQDLAEKHRIDFFEVSAKEGRGIDDAFLRLAELVVEAQKNEQVEIYFIIFQTLFRHWCEYAFLPHFSIKQNSAY